MEMPEVGHRKHVVEDGASTMVWIRPPVFGGGVADGEAVESVATRLNCAVEAVSRCP